MQKGSFKYNVSLLLLVGLIIKIIGLFNKIYTVRVIGTEGLSILMLVMPTIMFIISLSQFGFSISLSKKISENSDKKNHYLISTIIFSLFLNTILTLLLFTSIDLLTETLMKNSSTKIPILLSIPFIIFSSFNSILRGYFSGLKKFNIVSSSMLIEQLSRVLLNIVILTFLVDKFSIPSLINLLIITMTVGEIFSLIYYFIKISNKKNIFLIKKYFNFSYLKDVLLDSLYLTLCRIISSFYMFIEPIILFYIVLLNGYEKDVVTNLIVIINGYTIPTLTMIFFLTYSISISLIPEISIAYKEKNNILINSLIWKSIKIVIFACVYLLSLLFVYTNEVLDILYKNSSSLFYVKILIPIAFLMYIDSIFSAAIHGIGEIKHYFNINIIVFFIKVLTLVLLAYYNYFELTIIVGLTLSVLYSTYAHYTVLQNKTEFSINIISFFKVILLFLISIFVLLLLPLTFIINVIIFTIIYMLFLLKYYNISAINILKSLSTDAK